MRCIIKCIASDYDNWGTSTAFGTVYSAKNKATSKSAIVPADANKYEKGLEQAITTFLSHHVNEFKTKFYN